MNWGVAVAADEIRVIGQVARPGVEHGEVQARAGVELADERADRAVAGRARSAGRWSSKKPPPIPRRTTTLLLP